MENVLSKIWAYSPLRTKQILLKPLRRTIVELDVPSIDVNTLNNIAVVAMNYIVGDGELISS